MIGKIRGVENYESNDTKSSGFDCLAAGCEIRSARIRDDQRLTDQIRRSVVSIPANIAE